MPTVETPEQREKRLAKLRANGKLWRARNPDYFKKYYKNVMCEPVERARLRLKRKEWGMRRRATMKRVVVVRPKQIRAWLKALRQKPAVVCYYCRETIPTKKLHVDHVIAISRGGEHSPANLAASCSDCNMAKGARPIQQWQRAGQQILSL